MLHALRQRPLQARNIKARFALMKDNSGKAQRKRGKGEGRVSNCPHKTKAK